MKAVGKTTYKELHVGLPVMLNGMKTRRFCTGIYSKATPIHYYNFPSSNPTLLLFFKPPTDIVQSRPFLFFFFYQQLLNNCIKTRWLCTGIYSKATSIYNFPNSNPTLLLFFEPPTDIVQSRPFFFYFCYQQLLINCKKKQMALHQYIQQGNIHTILPQFKPDSTLFP